MNVKRKAIWSRAKQMDASSRCVLVIGLTLLLAAAPCHDGRARQLDSEPSVKSARPAGLGVHAAIEPAGDGVMIVAAADAHGSPKDGGKAAKDAPAEPQIPESDAIEKLPPAEQYCARVGEIAATSQFARQRKELEKAQKDVEARIKTLTEKAEELKKWSKVREDFMKKATESLLEIYRKMKPETAASQLIVMDHATAAAIVAKLPPKSAGAILAEMEPKRAARLSSVLAGAGDIDAPPAAPAVAPAGKP